MSALDGLRILELTQVMAGPFCGQVLADMGADVVKIEPPDGRLDAARARLPHARGHRAFLAVNRNKRSLALDLKYERAPGGAPPARRATPTCVLENYRPGVAARLGADWETLRALNPRLVLRERVRASGRPARTRSGPATT